MCEVHTVNRNIVVEDPRPTMQLFMLLLSNAGMDTCNGHLVSRQPGDVHGVLGHYAARPGCLCGATCSCSKRWLQL